MLLSPGNINDIALAPALLAAVGPIERLIADKDYDANNLRKLLAEQGATAVIPSTTSRSQSIPYIKTLYRQLNLIERMLAQGRKKPRRWRIHRRSHNLIAQSSPGPSASAFRSGTCGDILPLGVALATPPSSLVCKSSYLLAKLPLQSCTSAESVLRMSLQAAEIVLLGRLAKCVTVADRAGAPPLRASLHVLLKREGYVINHKKLFRLYREEKLAVRCRGGRKRAIGNPGADDCADWRRTTAGRSTSYRISSPMVAAIVSSSWSTTAPASAWRWVTGTSLSGTGWRGELNRLTASRRLWSTTTATSSRATPS